ncbi:MAG: hypothetical protein AB1634_06760 [Thermodesulfobacteriota bacterium]
MPEKAPAAEDWGQDWGAGENDTVLFAPPDEPPAAPPGAFSAADALKDLGPTQSPYDFSPPGDDALAEIPAFDEINLDEPAPDRQPSKGLAAQAAAAPPLSPARDAPAAPPPPAWRQSWTRLADRLPREPGSRRRWWALGAGGSLLALAILVAFLLSGDKPPPLPEAPHPPAATDVPEEPPPHAAPAPAATPPAAVASQTQAWRLPGFLIPFDEGEDKGFIAVTLSIEIAADSDGTPAEVRKRLLRDMVYQFYANTPASELKEFKLTRIRMEQRLRAWMQAQWPDIQIERIRIERYEIV